MSPASKLQLKPGRRLLVIGRPDGVDLDVAGAVDATAGGEPAAAGAEAGRGLDAAAAGPAVSPADGTAATAADAVLAFVARREQLDERAAPVVAAARRDGLAWIAYPKAQQLGTDLNRDILAALMLERGVRAVRQVSLDETWSALRLRPPRP